MADRHLQEGGRVLYDLSSSYFEGTQCPLAKRGYSRDQKKGKLQVNYGLLTDERGCPVSISAFPGNTSDPTTLLPQVERLQGAFNLKSVILVGDRGMISQKQVEELKGHAGVDWITALKTGAIRKLMDAKRFSWPCLMNAIYSNLRMRIFREKSWLPVATRNWRLGENTSGRRC